MYWGVNRTVFMMDRNLVRGSAAEAVGLIAVDPQHLDGPLDAEMVKDTAHLQIQQIILPRDGHTLAVAQMASLIM